MYDLAVIGAGWAGFNAATRARDLGLKVALIEKEYLGGTCLNRGCIPTKTLIQSAKIYALNQKSATFGITAALPQINLVQVQDRKEKIIQQLRQGMQFMLKGIDYFNTEAEVLSPEEIKIKEETLKTKFILLATGSRPAELKGLKFDGKKIISSDEILNLKTLPNSLLIIGGGVIGCEFASLFSALGCKVHIVEKMPQLLPGLDKEVAKKLETIFKKKGMQVNTNQDAEGVSFENYDLVLLCVGRIPDTQGLGLDKLGVELEKGKIIVDNGLQTNVVNIYAAGDCTAKLMLAHFAAYQGRMAAENIAQVQDSQRIAEPNIPNCIFTDPEIASVGLTQEEAENQNLKIKIHKFHFLASGMARILDETEGFIKIISHQQTSQILGGHIVGPRATELIGILTLAIQNAFSVSQVQKTVLAHPTLSESIIEALEGRYAI